MGNSRPLLVKFWGSQKLICGFSTALAGVGASHPRVVRGSTVMEIVCTKC